MAKFGFDDLVITLDDSAGAPQNISGFVTTINGVSIENILEEVHTAGDSWVEQEWVGLSRMADITLGGFYDDTVATGIDAVVDVATRGVVRTLVVLYGGTKSTTVECELRSYNRQPVRGELDKFELVLAPTAAPVEA